MTKERSVELLLVLPLLLLAITGVLSPFKYNLAPVNAVLEVVLVCMALVLMKELSRAVSILFYCALAYVVISAIWAVGISDANMLDFMLAYKAFYYVLVLSFFVGKQNFSIDSLVYLYWALIAAFLVKYGYSITLGFDAKMRSRPGLFVENNFELVFIMLLFYRLSGLFKNKLIAFIPLFAVVALSGSRSAVLALVVVYVLAFVKDLDIKTVLSVLVASVIAIFAYEVFVSRAQDGFENIDRLRFLMVFLEEMRSQGLLGYVFGTPRITALSPDSCGQLAFYSGLFSFSGDTTLCYSVILHSYVLRVIFDHGLLGLIFLNLFLLVGVVKSNGGARDFVCVALVLFLSGLSVSSFNSVFSAIALAVVFSSLRSDGGLSAGWRREGGDFGRSE